MKRLKCVTAGALHYDYLVPITSPPGGRGRGPKTLPSTPERIFANEKNAWRQLELLIAANFGPGDLVVTVTYDNEHLPESKAAAKYIFSQKFVKNLRAARKKRRQATKYIYVTEGFHGRIENGSLLDDSEWEDHRLHHHFVLNGCGPGDLEEIKSLWPYGTYVRVEPLDIHYYRELAKYLTKEPREEGRPKPGERTWEGSRNLRRETVTYLDVPDNLTLEPPPDAVDAEHFDIPSPEGYGKIIWTRYLILEEAQPRAYSYTRGRGAPSRKNELETKDNSSCTPYKIRSERLAKTT